MSFDISLGYRGWTLSTFGTPALLPQLPLKLRPAILLRAHAPTTKRSANGKPTAIARGMMDRQFVRADL